MKSTRSTEFASAMRVIMQGNFPTCVSGPINMPIYKGQPNPCHGKYFFVGSIPAACYDQEKRSSLKYDTEQDAINAAIAAGATRIQRCDCSFVEIPV